jgi:hypothetical protein
LHRANDPFLGDWNLDLTTAAARRLHANRIDSEKQRSVEAMVTTYLQGCFCFVVIPVADRSQRLLWESRIISTVAACPECQPSRTWLGLSSPISKIRDSGLWQVNELYKAPFSASEYAVFERVVTVASV